VARIKLDLDRRIGRLDRRVFGGFIEHLGRCIYGGGVFDENSPLSDERGYRRDVLEAAKNLRIPILRWPGGNFVSGYHWTGGIGPREERRRKMDLAWSTEESNRFGTDEFIEYCRMLGAEPYICVNMGTGTMDEAQAWVEYCNKRAILTGPTSGARTATRSRITQVLGTGQRDVREVADQGSLGRRLREKAREFAKVMRWTDPNIELVGCGLSGLTDWDRVVIEGLAPFVDYHSIHIYTGSDDYWSHVFAPHQADRLRMGQPRAGCDARLAQERVT
jgi:alpha-L-arabinofuranosidase